MTPMSSQLTPQPILRAKAPQTGLGFLSLPLEIRLLIYDKLLIQTDDLLRTFCTCKFCANLDSPTIGREFLNPTLLRTNKAIFNEALPILYSKNVFSFFCYGPFASASRLTVPSNWRVSYPSRSTALNPGGQIPGSIQTVAVADRSSVNLVANRHSPWAGVARINKCPTDAAKSHVRRIFFKLDSTYHKVLDGFPSQWWSAVEADVLRFFPGLEKMQVQLAVKEIAIPAFYLVLRRKDLMMMTREPDDYKGILANAASLLYSRPSAKEDLRNLEAVCDAIVTSQTQGEMKNCRFGVEMVGWTDDSLNGERAGDAMGKSFSIHLGCR